MSFTLRDPRMEAFSNAGQNFGKGFGEKTAQAMDNRNFNKALENADPNDLVGMLQKFAQHNVSQQQQEMYMSPVIQQRLQAQQATQIIDDAVKNAKSPKDIVTGVLKAQAAMGRFDSSGQLMDYAMGQFMSNQQAGPQEQGQNLPPAEGNKPAGSSQSASSSPSGVQSAQTSKNALFPNVVQTPLRGAASENIPARPNVRPYTEKEAEDIRNNLRKTLPSLKQADAEADRKINLRQQEYNNQLKEMELADRERQEQDKQETKLKEYVSQQMTNEYAGSPYSNTEFQRMANDLALGKSGTNEKRYQMVKNDYLDPMQKRLNSIDKKMGSPPMLEGLHSDKKQTYLKSLNPDNQAYLDLFPPEYKRIGYETLRTQLRNRTGIGPISAEYAIKMPDQNVVKVFRALPFSPDVRISTEKGEKDYQKKISKAVEKLPEMITRAINRGQSPLVLKDLVVNGRGYRDEVFDQAMAKAIEDGLVIPDWYKQSYEDSKKKFNPDLQDVIQGNALLDIMEFYR